MLQDPACWREDVPLPAPSPDTLRVMSDQGSFVRSVLPGRGALLRVDLAQLLGLPADELILRGLPVCQCYTTPTVGCSTGTQVPAPRLTGLPIVDGQVHDRGHRFSST